MFEFVFHIFVCFLRDDGVCVGLTLRVKMFVLLQKHHLPRSRIVDKNKTEAEGESKRRENREREGTFQRLFSLNTYLTRAAD